MASEDLASAHVFHRKAGELNNKGHLLRAAENYGRAAEAFRALDPAPDNLVAVEMQTCQAHMLLNHVVAVNAAAADARDAAASLLRHRADCVALLSTAVAALERRRVAGTLLEGKCTAAEEAWDAAQWIDAEYPAAEAASLAKLVGYQTFISAAQTLTVLLGNAIFFDTGCSATQLQAFAQHIVHAADLMQLPRSHCTIALVREIEFADTLSPLMAYLAARRLDARLVQLTDAWQRLKRSGVLETRGILDEVQRRVKAKRRETFHAVIDAAMAAPGLRTCALAGCGAKEAHPQHFKSCAACRTVVYCCREHQVEGWPSHKKACKAACKAAAASEAGGGAGPGDA